MVDTLGQDVPGGDLDDIINTISEIIRSIYVNYFVLTNLHNGRLGHPLVYYKWEEYKWEGHQNVL